VRELVLELVLVLELERLRSSRTSSMLNPELLLPTDEEETAMETRWMLALALALFPTLPAGAQVTGGVMAVTQAEMS
jgi:hypothetical protein